MHNHQEPDIITGSSTWLWMKRKSGRAVIIGLNEEALEACGLIVHIELPEAGDHILQGAPCLLVETMSAEIELPAPLSGRVSLVNGLVERNPGLIYHEPGERSWLLEVEEMM